MPAPQLTFTIDRDRISSVGGYRMMTCFFTSDRAYVAFEARATRASDPYGRGVGTLIAAFSSTPAGVSRTVEVYDTDLVSGEGEYRISLYAQSEDGGWNDNHAFIPVGFTGLNTADNKNFLSMR